MKIVLPVSMALGLVVGALTARAEMKLPDLKKQPSAQAVLDEHFEALNKCDWNRLLAQYPDDAQINLPGGKIVKGRAAIGDLFAGFCKDLKTVASTAFISRSRTVRRLRTRSPPSGLRPRPFWPSHTEGQTPT
jgi:hypothetical protein